MFYICKLIIFKINKNNYEKINRDKFHRAIKRLYIDKIESKNWPYRMIIYITIYTDVIKIGKYI